MNSLLFASIGGTTNAAKDVLVNALNSQDTFKTELDLMWTNVIGAGGLWSGLCGLGGLFAIVTLVFFTLALIKEFVEEQEFSTNLSQLIWPVIVAILLTNNGAMLADLTRGMRGIISGLNNNMLSSVVSQVDLKETYEKAMGRQAAEYYYNIANQDCSNTDLNKYKECMAIYQQNADSLIPANNNAQNQNFFDAIKNGIANIFNNIGDGIGSAVAFVPLQGVKFFLLTVGNAFQVIVEIALLLTGLLGPLAVGGTLLPVGQKAIFAWMVGFYSIGMVKLCYNIMVGLFSTLLVSGDGWLDLGFALVMGILAPLLSLVLAVGGGMAIFNSLLSTGGGALGKFMGGR
jgi:hypothetical protein